MKTIFKVLIIHLLVSFTVSAQNVSFVSSVDAKQIVEDGYVNVTFTLKNAEGGNFRPPPFKNFDVVSGPSSSSQTTIVNGKMSRTMSYSYTLGAKKLGKFSIGPASIQIGGKLYRTKPVAIEVLKGRPKAKAADGSDLREIFVQLELSDSTVYIGQQITAKYMLYTTKDVSSADFNNEPSYEGFFAKRVRNLSDRAERIIIDGVQYTKKSLKTIAIFPQQTGSFTLDAVNVNLGLPVNNSRRNSFFFSTRTKPFRTKTNPVTINVLNTPLNAPASFSGAIGKYTMTASIDKSTVTTDDAITMTMHVRGIGDGKAVQAPQQVSNDFDIYDPNVLQDETNERGDEIRVDKVFEYLMVPNQKGMYTVKPEFTYFDIDSNKYMTLYAQNYRVRVLQGTGSRASLNIDKDNLGEIQAFNTSTALHAPKRSFFGSPLHLVCMGIPFLSLLGIVVYKRRMIAESQIDPSLKRQSAARQLAMSRLESAAAARQEGNQKQFYEEINNGIYGYISDKFLVDHADLNLSHITQVLTDQSVPSDKVASLKNIIGTCQRALYASSTAENMDTVYDQAVDLISGMEE